MEAAARRGHDLGPEANKGSCVSDEVGIGAVMRQSGGFLLAGTLAFLADALVLVVLTQLADFSPFVARLFAIATAMLVSWLLNRTITFRVGAPPSAREFVRFAALAWITAALNYVVFDRGAACRSRDPSAVSARHLVAVSGSLRIHLHALRRVHHLSCRSISLPRLRRAEEEDEILRLGPGYPTDSLDPSLKMLCTWRLEAHCPVETLSVSAFAGNQQTLSLIHI